MKSMLASMLFLAAFQSGSFAQTWTPVTPGSPSDVTMYTAFFLNRDTGWVGGEGALIRKTTDGGASWTHQTGSQNITCIKFLNANTGWAVGGSGGSGVLLKTTNGGANWIAKGAGTNTEFRGGVFLDANTGWVTGFSGTILKTTNGGNLWTPQPSGTTQVLRQPHFANADTGWVIGTSLLLKTTNGGTTWVAKPTGATSSIYALYFLNASVGYAGGAGGTLFKTTDGGETWAPAPSTGVTQDIVSILFLDAQAGWITGGLGLVLKTVLPVPTDFSYADNPASYASGTAITPNTASVLETGRFSFSSVPALPAGLTLNPVTGTISGTPTVVSPQTDYEIIAAKGFTTTRVTLTITILPPTALSPTVMRGETFGFRASGASRLTFPVPRQGMKTARVEVMDLRGVKLWETTVSTVSKGADILWNGRSSQGNIVPTGLYVVRLHWLQENADGTPTTGSLARQFSYLR
jgi:photosystem II stability/assembly factor-like uncharacterized protein